MAQLTALAPVTVTWDEAARRFTASPATWLPYDDTQWSISAAMHRDRMLVRQVRRTQGGAVPGLAGKLTLRMAAGGPAVVLHASYDETDPVHADQVHPTAVRFAVRFVSTVAQGLHEDEARRRARAAHPSAQRPRSGVPGEL